MISCVLFAHLCVHSSKYTPFPLCSNSWLRQLLVALNVYRVSVLVSLCVAVFFCLLFWHCIIALSLLWCGYWLQKPLITVMYCTRVQIDPHISRPSLAVKKRQKFKTRVQVNPCPLVYHLPSDVANAINSVPRDAAMRKVRVYCDERNSWSQQGAMQHPLAMSVMCQQYPLWLLVVGLHQYRYNVSHAWWDSYRH